MKRRSFLQLLPPALTQPSDFKLPALALIVFEDDPLPASLEGLRFTNAAREKSPWHALLTSHRDQSGNPPTLAQSLKTRNYRTAFLGPWRMGDGAGQGARQRGFDIAATKPAEAAAWLASHPNQSFLCANGGLRLKPSDAHIITYVSFAKPEILIQWAGAASRSVKSPVSLMDVFPTLMQYATAPVIPGQVDGQNLWPWITGER